MLLTNKGVDFHLVSKTLLTSLPVDRVTETISGS